jgi:dienelactone hydrolase
MGRRLLVVALAFTAAALAACGSTAGSAPAAGTTAPSLSQPAPASPAISSAQSTAPGGAAPNDESVIPSVATERTVWVPAGDHRVPGSLTLPALAAGQQVPAVLLLHGDLSSRDENGDLFGRLADALSERGIGSLRIDFAGSGESEQPDLALDYPSMVADATASLHYLETNPSIDPARIAVLGQSRGGSIAATVAGTVPGVDALVSWSGAVANGYEEDPDAHQDARENGYVAVDFGDDDSEFKLSLAWFDTILESHPLDDVAGYTGPVLAVVGSDDDIVPPEISEIFLETVASADTTLHTIDGADHGFTSDAEYGDEAIAVTTEWLVTRFHLP